MLHKDPFVVDNFWDVLHDGPFFDSTPLFSSIEKLGSGKISSISLFRNDLGHSILRIPIASFWFDTSDIRPSGVATIQGKIKIQLFLTALDGLDKNTLCCVIFLENSHYMLFHASCFLWVTEVDLLLKI